MTDDLEVPQLVLADVDDPWSDAPGSGSGVGVGAGAAGGPVPLRLVTKAEALTEAASRAEAEAAVHEVRAGDLDGLAGAAIALSRWLLAPPTPDTLDVVRDEAMLAQWPLPRRGATELGLADLAASGRAHSGRSSASDPSSESAPSSQSGQPTESAPSSQSEQPTESAPSSQAGQPTESAPSSVSGQPTEPTPSSQSGQPAEPTPSSQSGQPAESAPSSQAGQPSAIEPSDESGGHVRGRRDEREEPRAIAADHARLFVGPGKVIAPPYESVHRSFEGLLFDEETLAVRAWYQRFGMSAPRVGREPDDHLGLELEFLATLLGASLEALDEDDEHDATLFAQEAGAFLDAHVRQWAPEFFEVVLAQAQTDFYRGVARLGLGLLEESAAILPPAT